MIRGFTTLRSQDGFTAAELLISLIIAVMFIVSAQQLYTIVVNNAGQVRLAAAANNLAYDTLRQYQDKASKPCSVLSTAPDPPTIPRVPIPTEYDLSNGKVTVDITCPYNTSGMSDLSLVTVTVEYSNPRKASVQHAIVVGN